MSTQIRIDQARAAEARLLGRLQVPDALRRAWERTARQQAEQRRAKARTVARTGMRSQTAARPAWARDRVTETRRAARSLQRPLRWLTQATADDETLEIWRGAVARMQVIPSDGAQVWLSPALRATEAKR